MVPPLHDREPIPFDAGGHAPPSAASHGEVADGLAVEPAHRAVRGAASGAGVGAASRIANGAASFGLWPLEVDGRQVEAAVLSMGNPHAVLDIRQFDVADVDAAPVATLGPLIEHHRRFPHKVNVGFMQVQARKRIRLRVWERDAGETLACGTGASAAVVAGIRCGLLDREVEVEARGGILTIAWPGDDAAVSMTGPAETVYEGEIEL
jgi:diaminopimelate epimerase